MITGWLTKEFFRALRSNLEFIGKEKQHSLSNAASLFI
jgi:hypothetical protein